MDVAQSDWKILTQLRRTFRSLHYRNFRLFLMGQGVSVTGTWMQMIAVGWLAYELTAGEPEGVRALWLGIVGFAGRIPTFIFAPFGGVFVDRWNRRNLVIVTQIMAMIQAAFLAVLTLLHVITLGQLIMLSLMLGMINAFDVPGRQSFMFEIVDKPADLSNAIALNSSLFTGARIIGPALAGILLKTVGTGFCFLFNAVSYIAVIAALLAIRVKACGRIAVTGHVLKNMSEGVRYVFKFSPVRSILFMLMVVSLSGASYPVLLPVFSSNILHHGSGLYALLFAAAGFGALIGAMFLAVRESVRGLLWWIAAAPIIFGIGLILLGVSRWIWLSVLAMPVIGFGLLVQTAASNTVIQTLIENHMRGRVMSFYSMAFMGMMPLGSLLSGFMSRLVGAPVTVLLNGLLCIAGALVFFRHLKELRRQVHPIYVQKGIITETNRGLTRS